MEKVEDLEVENIIEHIPNGICIYEYDGKDIKVLNCNSAFYSTLGHSKEYIENEKMIDIVSSIHPKDKEKFSKWIKENIKENGIYSCSYRTYNEKTKAYANVYIRANVSWNLDNKATIYVSLDDVTKIEQDRILKQEEIEHFNSIEKKLFLKENKLLGSLKYNITKNLISDYNNKIKNSFGSDKILKIEDFEDMIKLTIVNDIDRVFFEKELKRESLINSFKEKKQISHDYYRRNRKGNVFLARTIAVPTVSPLSNNEYYVFYTYDITEVERKNEVIKKIIYDNYEFASLIDVKTGRLTDTKIAEPNFDEEQLMKGKYPSNNSKYNDIVNLFADNYIENNKEQFIENMNLTNIINKLEKKKQCSYSTIVIENGQEKQKLWKESYLDDKKDRIILVRMDVTNVYKKNIEYTSNLNKVITKLEEASAAKSAFLSRVSHDLRTPMNAVLTLSEFASEENNIDEIHKYIKDIRNSGEYLLNLINDILDIQKLEADKVKLQPMVTNINEVFKQIVFTIKPAAQSKNIIFNFKTNHKELNISPICYVDPIRIKQIFMNLLSNAIKFTQNGGNIQLNSEIIKQTDKCIVSRFQVIDNGYGMSEEFQKIMFESFTQDDTSSHSKYQGTGLGLAIVKQLVDLMHGTITCTSKLNEGTCFTMELTFDLATKEQIEHTEKIEKTEVVEINKEIDLNLLRGKRILLCEDHPLNREIAIRLLKMNELKVESAENGKIGVEMFNSSSQNYYDLILMDVRMPVMDGIEATKTIRNSNHPQGKTIPIIAMTANALEEDFNASKEAGMNEHILKPIDTKHFIETIAKFIK